MALEWATLMSIYETNLLLEPNFLARLSLSKFVTKAEKSGEKQLTMQELSFVTWVLNHMITIHIIIFQKASDCGGEFIKKGEGSSNSLLPDVTHFTKNDKQKVWKIPFSSHVGYLTSPPACSTNYNPWNSFSNKGQKNPCPTWTGSLDTITLKVAIDIAYRVAWNYFERKLHISKK